MQPTANIRPSPPTPWRTALASALVCAAGFGLAHTATDGFQAYTLETARRLKALHAPVPVPNLSLELADGGYARLVEVPAKVLLVDFIYTSCTTYCTALGSVYARLRERLAAEIDAGDVRLVSISFDPGRDGRDELRTYRGRYSRDPAGWDIGRPAQADDVQRWLDAFGVVVIPDELGGYAHNAAVHVVGPGRRLVAIHDLEDIDGITRTARAIAGWTQSHATQP